MYRSTTTQSGFEWPISIQTLHPNVEWDSQKKCYTLSWWKTQKGKPDSSSYFWGFSKRCAYFWTLSNSEKRYLLASLIAGFLFSISHCFFSFSTKWVKMVWLIGSRSRESSCLTSLRHIGHLTLLFLKITNLVLVELFQAGSAEGMPTMNQNSRNSLKNVIVIFAKLASVFVE